jgi:hypothetical protein
MAVVEAHYVRADRHDTEPDDFDPPTERTRA